MNDFVITTENTSDLPKDYYSQNGITYMYLPCTIDGVVYNKENEMPSGEFYEKMRGGSMPTTSQINPNDAKTEFSRILDEGKGIPPDSAGAITVPGLPPRRSGRRDQKPGLQW